MVVDTKAGNEHGESDSTVMGREPMGKASTARYIHVGQYRYAFLVLVSKRQKHGVTGFHRVMRELRSFSHDTKYLDRATEQNTKLISK